MSKDAYSDVKELFNIPTSNEETKSSNPEGADFNNLTEEVSEDIKDTKSKGIKLEEKKNESNKENEDLPIDEIVSQSYEKACKSEEKKDDREDSTMDDLLGDCDALGTDDDIAQEIMSHKPEEEEHGDLEEDFNEIVEGDDNNSVNDSKNNDESMKENKAEEGSTDIKPIEEENKKSDDKNVIYEERDDEEENCFIDVKGVKKIKWKLTTEVDTYKKFYAKKREYIKSFIKGREIPFELYQKELSELSVDVTTEVLDQKLLLDKLDAVQRCIERVRQIQLVVNNQYFIWKRFIELMRGSLARAQYVKPQIKQEGLVNEHMGDIELYFALLHHLQDISHTTMKTLDSAFVCLSRKVTLALDPRKIERYDYGNKRDVSSEVDNEYKEEMKHYDSLPNESSSSNDSKVKTNKMLDWDEM